MSRGWRIASRSVLGTPTGLAAYEHSLPEPGRDEVVIAPAAAWIAASPDPSGTDTSAGRSAVGEVIAAGPSAVDLIGKTVVVPWTMACGECDTCRRGAAAVCPSRKRLGIELPGAAAERMLAHGRWIVALAGGLTLEAGAGALAGGPALDAYGLYARTGIAPKDPTVIFGDDLTARLLADILIAKGAPPVVATKRPAFAALIEARGGRALDADAGPGELAAAVAAMSPGARPRRVFCTATDADHRASAAAATTPGGTLTLLGGPASPSVDLTALAASEVSVVGVAAGHPDLLSEVCALAVRGELELEAAVQWVEAAEQIPLLDDPTASPRGWVLRPGRG